MDEMKLRAGWADPPRRRRHLGVIVVLVLLPLSAVIAFAIQQAMAGLAAATGGCGGG